MTPVFITGLDDTALQSLGQQLAPLGLPGAQPLARDPKITLGNWHQRVHAAGQNPPARMWEQLASELFLANMAQPQWSWADPLTLQLLDYWAAFDPAIRFVLVAENPLQTVLRQQSSKKTVTNNTPADALQYWQQTHHVILRFALRHPQRCLLLWQHQAQDLGALAQALQTRWGLHIQAPSNPSTNASPNANANTNAFADCALAQHLGQVLSQNHPNAQQLLADLHANVHPLLHSPASTTSTTPEPHQLLARYQQLSELSQQAALIPALQLTLKSQTQKTADAEKSRSELQAQHASQLSQLQAELKQAQTQAQEQAKAAKAASDQQLSAQQKLQDQLKQGLTQAQTQAQEQAKAAKAASDQQLSAQQQLEGELKQALTQAQEQAKAAKAASDQHLSAQQKIEGELKQAQTQAQEQAKAAKAATDQQLSAQQKLQAEHKQALTQAQEQAKVAKAASDQQLSAQQKLQAELKQAQTQAQEQAQAAQAQKEQLQQQHQESQEEAELLLNQLHVVQEELENYYYRNKELQAQATALTQLQQRWQQLFMQNRDLYAVENLSIQAGQTGEFVCQLQQLEMAGRHFDQLELSLQLLTDGSTAMRIQRPAQGQGPLLRWPSDVAPGTPLTLQPQLHPDTPPQRLAAFIQLSSSDWQLVQNLHRLLLAALAQGLPTLPASDQQSLLTALQQSQQHLQGLRHMLRFDAAQCPQAPTPEQLHLQLQGVSLQGQHTPQLNLQLQQHSAQHTSLQMGASPLTATGQAPDAATQIHLTPQGWYSDGPTPSQLPHMLGQLMAVLPLALVDAVHHGTEKSSLKPWADTCRTLRQWPQTPCEPPAPTPVKPQATAKPKTKPTAPVNPKPKPKLTNQPTATPKASAKAPTKSAAKTPANSPAKALAKAPEKATEKSSAKTPPKATEKSPPKALTKKVTPAKPAATAKPAAPVKPKPQPKPQPKPKAAIPTKALPKVSAKAAHAATVTAPNRAKSPSRKAVA